MIYNAPPKDLIPRARAFAIVMHADQLYDGRPYIVHLDRVAEIVRAAGGCPWMIAAAYLHDVLEDTPCTMERLAMVFGIRVAGFVYAVTGRGANRAERQQSILMHLAYMPSARLLKLADRVANVEYSVAKGNAQKLAMYRKEAPLYRDVFASIGHPLAMYLEALLLAPAPGLCVCVLVERKGQLLSVQRRHRPEFIGLPGGKVDEGEQPVMAALREFEEETGYTLSLEQLRLVYCAPDETDVMTATFVAHAGYDWPDQAIGPEGTDVAFVPAEHLTDPTKSEFSDYNKAMLEALTNQRRHLPTL
jgi:8-oxo-dGTP pyrophosphatase MutT (NUDIX family)